MPFVSVIVPAYNVEKYVGQCVESILAQSFTDFELLLVDDGSTDSTGQLCDGYAMADARVRVLHKENGGLVSARKAGLEAAGGYYAAYVDGDDWIASDMLQSLCLAAKRETADIVIADFMLAKEKEQVALTQNMEGGVYGKKELEEKIYPCMLSKGEYFSFGFQPSLCAKLFRRELLLLWQETVDERIRLGEDAACFFPCLLEAEKVVYLKGEHDYFYRMRETSISHAIVKTYYTEELLLLVGHLEECFRAKESQWEVLEQQLWSYACYMLDNMLTPHLRLREVFGQEGLAPIKQVAGSHTGKCVIKYGKEVRTSSRMKRILKTMENPCLRNRLELYLFRRYEILRSKKGNG